MATPTFSKIPKSKKSWYESEKNTAALLQAVVSARRGKPLSGDDIWYLLRLTWYTRSADHGYWKKLKVPALCHLFPQDKLVGRPSRDATLQEVLDSMSLPKRVAETAAKITGNIGLYKGYWNSSKTWCKHHVAELREIIREAAHLHANDRSRWALAANVDALPKVPNPSGSRHKNPGDILTPLVAFLDPHCRFPMINQRKEVQALLREWRLAGSNLNDQVRGMTGIIGRFGISDAFMLDVLADELKKIAPRLNIPIAAKVVAPSPGSALPDFDTSEREYLRKAATIRYSQRHNKMMEGLKQILNGFKLTQGTNPDSRWDLLVERYEETGRDLLLELKPDPEKAAIRIAIGQLLDYRRFVDHPAVTDIAVLTIGAPDKLYCQLLVELNISCIWFKNEKCRALDGEGSAWEALRESRATAAHGKQ
jgi:hypothetical protein